MASSALPVLPMIRSCTSECHLIIRSTWRFTGSRTPSRAAMLPQIHADAPAAA